MINVGANLRVRPFAIINLKIYSYHDCYNLCFELNQFIKFVYYRHFFLIIPIQRINSFYMAIAFA